MARSSHSLESLTCARNIGNPEDHLLESLTFQAPGSQRSHADTLVSHDNVCARIVFALPLRGLCTDVASTAD